MRLSWEASSRTLDENGVSRGSYRLTKILTDGLRVFRDRS